MVFNFTYLYFNEINNIILLHFFMLSFLFYILIFLHFSSNYLIFLYGDILSITIKSSNYYYFLNYYYISLPNNDFTFL